MSISIMTRVWAESQHKGSELLLLLAIADNANNQGVAYPSRRTLAKKTRMSDRHVKRLVQVLIELKRLGLTPGSVMWRALVENRGE